MINDLTHGRIREHPTLLLCIDGGCEPNPGGVVACAWVIYDANKRVLAEESRIVCDGGERATNNYAEYCALGFALKWLRQHEWRGDLTVRGDSQLLINQVAGKWKCRSSNLIPLRDRIWEYLDALFNCAGVSKPCKFTWISRDENTYAHKLIERAYDGYVKHKI